MSQSVFVRCPHCRSPLKLNSAVSRGETVTCPACRVPFEADPSQPAESQPADTGGARRPVVEKHAPVRGRAGQKKPRRWVAPLLIFGGVLIVCGGVLGAAGLLLKNMWDGWSREIATLPDVTVEETVGEPDRRSIDSDGAVVADNRIPSGESAVSATADPVELTFTAPDDDDGLSPLPLADGVYRIGTVSDRPALQAEDLYLYFDVHDAALHDLPPDNGSHFSLTATLFDDVQGTLDVQYDAHLAAADHDGRWTSTQSVELTGAGQWRTVTFDLPEARFANRQQGQADLRVRGHQGLTPVLHNLVLTRSDSGERKPPGN